MVFRVLPSALTGDGETEQSRHGPPGAGEQEEAHMATRLLTLRDVTAMTAPSRAAVYALIGFARRWGLSRYTKTGSAAAPGAIGVGSMGG